LNAFRLALRSFTALLIVLVAFSCTKEPNLIGIDLVPASELLRMGYTDTVQIEAFSMREDSVKSSNLNYALVGSMYDPVFGRTTADFYSQVYLSTEPTVFGTNPVLDSAFLYLPYSSAYGDTLSNMTLRVYPLEEDLLDSVQAYSNHTVYYDQNSLLGELTFTPRPHDSAYYDGGKQAPSLRIPLNKEIAQQILSVDTSVLATSAKFIQFFKGIAIIAEPQQTPGKGAILSFSIGTVSSNILLHYHNSTDTSTYSLVLNSSCQRFNHYEHYGYAEAAPFLKQQIAGDSTLGKQFIFVQAMGGVKVKLKFPSLYNWSGGKKVVINDAQLILTNASPSTVFEPPSSLALYPINNDMSLYAYQVPDYNEGTAYYDGTYNSSLANYRFRLTRYVQQLLNGTVSSTVNHNGLYMLVPASSVNCGRLALNGSGSLSTSLKLYLKYTVIK